jgi:pimeloyl-ACP methyl ester carboxylesterase
MAIAFDEHGAGPPLVLLHGIGSRRQVWDPVVGELARSRRVIAVDIPGFGESPLDGAEPSPPGFAAFLDRWFDERGIDRPHVAGNSMGGTIALELARRRCVASVTAISPGGFWTPRERMYARNSLKASRVLARTIHGAVPAIAQSGAGRATLFAQIYGRPWRMSPAEATATIDAFVDAPAFDGAMDAFRDYTFRGADDARGIPITIAWGSRDVLLIPRQARRAQRLMPWARNVLLPGCGHVPFHDDPEGVAVAILAGSGD